ncbi:hypothetical protein JCM16814_29780 [Desulfobaculum senezii]
MKKATISLQFSERKPVKFRLYAAEAFGESDTERFRLKQGEAWVRFAGKRLALVTPEKVMKHICRELRRCLGLPQESGVSIDPPTLRVGQVVTVKGEYVLEGEGSAAGYESELYRVMAPPVCDALEVWRVPIGKGPDFAKTCRYVPCKWVRPAQRGQR